MMARNVKRDRTKDGVRQDDWGGRGPLIALPAAALDRIGKEATAIAKTAKQPETRTDSF